MKIKTLRSILQTGIVLAIMLLVSLAIILIVQFVEIQNAKDKIEDLEQGEPQSYCVECDLDDGEVW